MLDEGEEHSEECLDIAEPTRDWDDYFRESDTNY